MKWGNGSVTEDGVHPTLAGHALLAKSWLEKIENDKGNKKNVKRIKKCLYLK
ncbi:hypothetical protein [Carnobacterium sp. TMP28]|uniref:hypothetical protein n=1 Tax=Carnobacterium sp. TMP28 TaxID=3397060 RepID=UPI0039E0CCFA